QKIKDGSSLLGQQSLSSLKKSQSKLSITQGTVKVEVEASQPQQGIPIAGEKSIQHKDSNKITPPDTHSGQKTGSPDSGKSMSSGGNSQIGTPLIIKSDYDNQ
ncbi:MAG: hypothetical protein EZS28_045658, partial [Streblomastix strix]